MYIHSIIPSSMVNGPYERTVVHFQGCTLNCPGCFNKDTHAMNIGRYMSAAEIMSNIPSHIKHVTISGGEPFLQAEGLHSLVTLLREKDYGIIVFSGFYLHEIMKMPYGEKILANIDVLIDGRFVKEELAVDGLRGSNNQTIHIFTNRYSPIELMNRNTEILIDTNGNIQITGFPSSFLLQVLKD